MIFGILICVSVLYLGLLLACIVKCIRKSDKQFRIVDSIFDEDEHNG